MGGRASRDKGARLERELVHLLRRIDPEVRRIPLSGASDGFPGDVECPNHRLRLWQSKGRSDGWRELYRWLDGHDALAVRADRKPWLVVMPLETLLEIAEAKEASA